MNVKTGTFVFATTDSGTKSVNIGFQPKALILLAGRAGSDATWSAHLAPSLGYITEAAHRSQAAFDEDALGTTETCCQSRSDYGLFGFSDGAGTIDWALTPAATVFTATGFDLTVTDAPSTNIIVRYIALAGSDVTDIEVGDTLLDGTAKPVNQDITVRTGFGQPDLVFTAGIHHAVDNAVTATTAIFSFGVFNDVVEQAAVSYFAEPNATVNSATYLAANGYMDFRRTTTAVLGYEATVRPKANWPTDGFSVTLNSGDQTSDMIWLALKGTFATKVGLASSPTSDGNQDLSPGFTAGAAVFFTDDLPAHGTLDNSHADGHGIGLGVYDGTDQGLVDFQNDDGNTTSVAKNISDASRVIRLTGPGATPADLGMAVASFPVGTTVRLAWTGVDATARQFAYAILEADAGGTDVTLVPATETDVAQALTFAQASDYTITPATETSVAQALTVTVGGPQTADLTPATETDAAQTLVVTKPIHKTIIPATETSTAAATIANKVITAVATTETAQALAVTKTIHVTLTPATTTAAAQAVTFTKTIHKTLTPATETDVAQDLSFAQAGTYTLGATTTTDVAQALAVTKTIYKTITPAAETDTAVTVGTSATVDIVPAVETSTAQALTHSRRLVLVPAGETDTSQQLSVTHTIYRTITPALETDVAVVLVGTLDELPGIAAGALARPVTGSIARPTVGRL